jgi:hypothetical protein
MTLVKECAQLLCKTYSTIIYLLKSTILDFIIEANWLRRTQACA